jgi:hypothetical protein
VEYVKKEAKIVYLLECLQKTAPPVIIFCERKSDVDDIHEYLLLKVTKDTERYWIDTACVDTCSGAVFYVVVADVLFAWLCCVVWCCVNYGKLVLLMSASW